MIDLKNNLTLTFVSLIHNFELKTVNINFRVLPSMGTIVATGLKDWKEFSIGFRKNTTGCAAIIGKSKDDIWSLIFIEWSKYTTYSNETSIYQTAYDQWVINYDQWKVYVVGDPSLPQPIEPTAPIKEYQTELEILFEYINTVKVK